MTKANGQMSKEIYLAGGCFWGAEHFLKQIEGVEATEVGYANGHTDRPTYEEVCTDKTGFAETVRVVYDPARVGLAFLLDLYFKAIDPTSVNQQGGDRGTQYRTGIYYVDEFIDFARQHPETTFLVTPIGCGIAGFTPADIAPLFQDAVEVENVWLPESFWHLLRTQA